MMRVKIQIGEIRHGGFTWSPSDFPSDWDKTNYLKNALAKNFHNFCVCKNRDPEAYTDVLYDIGIKWVKMQVTENLAYNRIL